MHANHLEKEPLWYLTISTIVPFKISIEYVVSSPQLLRDEKCYAAEFRPAKPCWRKSTTQTSLIAVSAIIILTTIKRFGSPSDATKVPDTIVIMFAIIYWYIFSSNWITLLELGVVVFPDVPALVHTRTRTLRETRYPVQLAKWELERMPRRVDWWGPSWSRSLQTWTLAWVSYQ